MNYLCEVMKARLRTTDLRHSDVLNIAFRPTARRGQALGGLAVTHDQRIAESALPPPSRAEREGPRVLCKFRARGDRERYSVLPGGGGGPDTGAGSGGKGLAELSMPPKLWRN